MPGNIGVREGEPVQKMKSSQQEVAGTRTFETGAKTWRMANNIRMQRGDPEKEDDDGVAITTFTSTLNDKHLVAPTNDEVVPRLAVGSGPPASPALPSYPVGRGISLPFGQLLPRCAMCNCGALISMTHRSNPEIKCVLCLDHGLLGSSVTRDLILLNVTWNRYRYSFISPEHEAAIRAFLA